MLTIRETQKVELEIMQKIHLYCEKHNICYVMTYGTLLGAVRHKGFIPWDNDMDIAMLRDDFNRFLALTKIDPIDEHIYVQHYTLDEKYHYMCIRVCDDRTVVNAPYLREQPERMGLWVDIFPMDGLQQGILATKWQKIQMKFYWGVWRADVYGLQDVRNPLHWVIKRVALILLPNKHNRFNYRIDKISEKNSASKSKYVDYIFEKTDNSKMQKRSVQNRILMSFEQYQFYAPKDYDSYLTDYYGNYMQLPPTDERVTHAIDANWTDVGVKI